MKPILIVAAAAMLVGSAMADDAKNLDDALRDQAPRILDLARARGAKNVGVLKFLAGKGDEAPSDNVGPLNLNIADRLTIAVILALPDEKIGVIGNANEILKETRYANHLSEDGRKRCFRGKGFSVPWGSENGTVKADLFVTGEVRLSPDLKRTSVKLVAFGPDGVIDESLGTFHARTTTRTLLDTGHRFAIDRQKNPTAFARDVSEDETQGGAIDLIGRNQIQDSKGTLSPSEQPAPVRVTLYYDDEPVKVENGAVREPKAHEKRVWFRIRNTTDKPVGVVLKVNGENTIERQRLADVDCRKWIVPPTDYVDVRGIQVSREERQEFKVSTPEESRENEVRYGNLGGTYSFSVFQEDEGKAPEPNKEPKSEPADEEIKSAAISRGSLTSVKPNKLVVLQSKLRNIEQTMSDARGGYFDGDATNTKPHPVTVRIFVPFPKIPVWTETVRYYKP